MCARVVASGRIVTGTHRRTPYVAFLRAVNVGGRGVVRMAEVQEAFASAGCANVRTVIASGNVLFDAPADTPAPVLDRRIRGRLAPLLGGEPVVIYRSMRALRRLVARAPFGALIDERALKLYVMFTARKPRKRPRFPLALPREGLEAIGMAGGDVLIVSRRKPSGWYGFPTLWIERVLGITTTARSWSTVAKMVERCDRCGGGERPPPRPVTPTPSPRRAPGAAGSPPGGRAGSRSRAS